jgi:rhamnose utilization protein RhaD (predicted bifunctional aldolase and dehydrogenase)
MKMRTSAISHSELWRLLDLAERVGKDPLLTQASTGNISAKLDDVMWIKASGRWMAEAFRNDFLVRLDLKEVKKGLRQQIDPAARF